MAEEHGIDLARIRGTGIEGRVTKGDFLAWLSREAPARAPEAAIAAPARAESVPEAVGGIRPFREEGFLRIPAFSVRATCPARATGDPFCDSAHRGSHGLLKRISPRVTTVAGE
jgi:pyruvate/2-oxoglutarate dehydrogenase complex dihydrolipoamide acyltransferase (E2) component